MKLIDREGRLFGKISIIDVLVLAVVIVMAVALYQHHHLGHPLYLPDPGQRGPGLCGRRHPGEGHAV